MKMENTITINGRVYQAKEFDFNFLCKLGEAGIDVTDIGKKILPSLRCYIAYCMGVDDEIAGDEFNKHVIANGGGFDELIEVFNKKAEESDFFRAISNTTTQENPATTSKKKNTKKEQEAHE